MEQGLLEHEMSNTINVSEYTSFKREAHSLQPRRAF